MARDDLRIVVRYPRTVRNGHHVLLGALDHDRPAGRWSVRFAGSQTEAIEAIEVGRREAERVLVTWSFYSADAGSTAGELTRLRARVDHDRVVHLAGGPHAAAEPERTLRAGWDLVATGEGEATFVGLVACLASGTPLDAARPAVAGLAWLDAGRLAASGPAARDDLDRWPAFAARWGRFNPIEITRGCVYACRFCQTPYLAKARFRHRSVADVRAHVAVMRTEGLRYVRFVSPSALSYGATGTEPDLDAVEALLAGVREELGPDAKVYFGSFPSEVRPEHVTRRALQLLRRYCDNDHVVIGGQSGSDAVLAAAHRGHGVDDIEQAARLARAEGFRVDVDLLFGLPGETPDDVRATLALAARLADEGVRLHSHAFLPLPGTPLRDAEPGRIDPATALELDRLASRGQGYGQWRTQQRVAVGLRSLRRDDEP